MLKIKKKFFKINNYAKQVINIKYLSKGTYT